MNIDRPQVVHNYFSIPSLVLLPNDIFRCLPGLQVYDDRITFPGLGKLPAGFEVDKPGPLAEQFNSSIRLQAYPIQRVSHAQPFASTGYSCRAGRLTVT